MRRTSFVAPILLIALGMKLAGQTAQVPFVDAMLDEAMEYAGQFIVLLIQCCEDKTLITIFPLGDVIL